DRKRIDPFNRGWHLFDLFKARNAGPALTPARALQQGVERDRRGLNAWDRIQALGYLLVDNSEPLPFVSIERRIDVEQEHTPSIEPIVYFLKIPESAEKHARSDQKDD